MAWFLNRQAWRFRLVCSGLSLLASLPMLGCTPSGDAAAATTKSDLASLKDATVILATAKEDQCFACSGGITACQLRDDFLSRLAPKLVDQDLKVVNLGHISAAERVKWPSKCPTGAEACGYLGVRIAAKYVGGSGLRLITGSVPSTHLEAALSAAFKPGIKVTSAGVSTASLDEAINAKGFELLLFSPAVTVPKDEEIPTQREIQLKHLGTTNVKDSPELNLAAAASASAAGPSATVEGLSFSLFGGTEQDCPHVAVLGASTTMEKLTTEVAGAAVKGFGAFKSPSPPGGSNLPSNVPQQVRDLGNLPNGPGSVPTPNSNPSAAKVYGFVYDSGKTSVDDSAVAPGGAPDTRVAGATVTASSSSGGGDAPPSATTDNAGGYSLNLTAGTWQLCAEANGYQKICRACEVGQGAVQVECHLATAKEGAVLPPTEVPLVSPGSDKSASTPIGSRTPPANSANTKKVDKPTKSAKSGCQCDVGTATDDTTGPLSSFLGIVLMAIWLCGRRRCWQVVEDWREES